MNTYEGQREWCRLLSRSLRECRTGKEGHVTRRDEEHTSRKVSRTDIPGKRKRGRPKIGRKDVIQRDLEKYWTKSERGDGQGDGK